MNSNIIDQFKNLIFQLKLEDDNKNIFKIKSFEKAVSILSNYPSEINNSDELKGISGIGKGILSRIDEILETGFIQEVHTQPDNSLLKFQEEIGTKTAINLYKQGIKTLDQLNSLYKDGKIEVTHRIELILKYSFGEKKFADKIPRNEMKKYYHYFVDIFGKHDIEFKMCGSFRRKKKTSNDIDLLIFNKDLISNVIKLLEEKHFLLDHLTDNIATLNTVYRGYCVSFLDENIVRRIDIRFIDLESKYTAIMYFTGSKNFNTKLRSKARSLGYKLNEYYLEKEGKNIYPKSEREIFNLLDVPYQKPQDRS